MEKPRYKNWIPFKLVAAVLLGAMALLLIARLLVERNAVAGLLLMLLAFAALFFGLYILRARTALDDDGDTVGYVYELVSRGYGGDIVLSVGVRNGAVSGVSVASHAETKGLGTADEAPFLQSFVGLTQADAAQGVDAMSGATVSSNAVRGAVSQALAHARDVLGAQEVE